MVFRLAVVVLVASLCALGYIGYTYWSAQRAYDAVAKDNFAPPSDVAGSTLADFAVDWDALRAVNPDVVGWVYVPGTKVSYPIVHRAKDDSHYLTHTFSGDSAGAFGAEFGCIMLSGENVFDFTDQVNIIYGHNMADGSMFAPFAKLVDQAAFDAHREMFVFTPLGNYRLRTFAVDRVEETDAGIVIPNFATRGELSDYVRARIDASLVSQPDPVDPAEVSQVFAFSTCDNANDFYRFITFARVVEYQPASAGKSAGFMVAPDDVSSVQGDVADRVA